MVHEIFLVEDDVSFRSLLGEYLEVLGYAVREFGSGEEVLRALEARSEPPDLVITDLNLGRLTGMQLLGALRECWPGSRVILMTAFGDADTAEEMGKAGAAGYLDKPFEFDALQELIEQVLENTP